MDGDLIGNGVDILREEIGPVDALNRRSVVDRMHDYRLFRVSKGIDQWEEAINSYRAVLNAALGNRLEDIPWLADKFNIGGPGPIDAGAQPPVGLTRGVVPGPALGRAKRSERRSSHDGIVGSTSASRS